MVQQASQQQTLVGVYRSRAEAEQVRDRLTAVGVPAGDIRLSEETDRAASGGTAPRERGFLAWLFDVEPSETDRAWYETNLHEGRTGVCVALRDGAVDAARIHGILEELEPIEIGAGTAAPAAEHGTPGASAAGDEQVIPVEKEELQVGKRQRETRHRIRTYTVERPVERQVSLKDERVVIERRPAQTQSTGAGAFEQHETEIVERHEEPVVGKRTKADEEVVVHKETTERPETVRDTVRETKVEVDKAAAGNKPSAQRE